MHVVVIGAGAVGLSSAYYLAGAGADVTVLDARDVGGGASRRNAGWVVPTMSAPVPAPGVVLKSLRWMLRKDSPLYVRPSLDPAFVRFMLGMLRRCNGADFDRGLRQTIALNSRTYALFDQLERDGVQFEHHRGGQLLVFLDEQTLQKHEDEMLLVAELGAGKPTVLSPDEARNQVPQLTREIVGAIDCPTERFLDPDSFVDGLAQACRGRGVRIQGGERVNGVDFAGPGRVRAVVGRKSWAADAFVLAAGAWSAPLTKVFGQSLPVRAGKGYGFDIAKGDADPSRALYLSEAKVALTPLHDRTRIAGTMAFGSIDESVDDVRAGGIVTSARRYLSGWPPGGVPRAWSGLRPMTPDGLPVIGRLPGHDNVVVATGHAMLGITLAPVTGDIVRQAIVDGTVPVEAGPFLPDRFPRRR